MKLSQAVQSFREYHRLNSKKNTLKNYEFIRFKTSHETPPLLQPEGLLQLP